jgi:hypothetical protein
MRLEKTLKQQIPCGDDRKKSKGTSSVLDKPPPYSNT